MLTLHILTTMSVYPKVNPTYTFDIKPVSVYSEEINIPLHARVPFFKKKRPILLIFTYTLFQLYYLLF